MTSQWLAILVIYGLDKAVSNRKRCFMDGKRTLNMRNLGIGKQIFETKYNRWFPGLKILSDLISHSGIIVGGNISKKHSHEAILVQSLCGE